MMTLQVKPGLPRIDDFTITATPYREREYELSIE